MIHIFQEEEKLLWRENLIFNDFIHIFTKGQCLPPPSSPEPCDSRCITFSGLSLYCGYFSGIGGTKGPGPQEGNTYFLMISENHRICRKSPASWHLRGTAGRGIFRIKTPIRRGGAPSGAAGLLPSKITEKHIHHYNSVQRFSSFG
jgi:hypothetical protein